jgi:hypothetical protein
VLKGRRRAGGRQRRTCRPGPEPSLVMLKVTQRVEGGSDVVELLVEEVGIDVRGHGNRGVAHRLLKQAKVGSGPPTDAYVWRKSCTRSFSRPI